ncbi:Hydrolase (HAD superfamily) [Candidatus Burkholderia verschuerenii]|uniref:Hydrolase (HAD superfamily) n=1 Tax=Candidatus Burkholderia verschuerenii TaxID=242163 RepID=A0A0L0MI91_9BURK|nr:Cof-type HAD-IIB family hydrolase [Candidatus Burkholderia verschuerenii]KND62021.1 Hydrolase (HAD superfamily) [Candidatus Burkholderia verschuerenii]
MDAKYGLHSVSGDTDAALEKLAQVELVVTDCDGTLLYTDKTLGDRAIAAVMGLHAAGVQFTVASSRPGKGMRHIVNPLKVTLPYGSYNGGSLVMPATWEVLSAHKLPRDVVQTSLETLAANGVDAWVFIDDNWYLTNPDGTYVPLETRTVGYDGVLVKRFDDIDLDAVDKIVGSNADTALMERVEGVLEKQLEGRGHAARSQTYYLDVTHIDANKGTAVRELSKRANVSLERIAVLGDMGNDMAMFDVAGVSIAMGQAAEKVQRGASLVSSSNDDDGFAVAIEALLTLRKG